MKRTLSIAILGVILFAASLTDAAIYTYRDQNGTFHFTNVTPANKKYRTVIFSGRESRGGFSAGSVGQSLTGDRKELIGFAKTYLGTPYKLGGDFTSGIDCSGFVKKVFSAFSIPLPRTAREQYREGRPIHKDNLLAGDLVFFRSPKSGDPAHVGIFIDEDKFIHATVRNGGGVRIDSLDEAYYRKNFIGASRLLQ